jgi:transposase-like protein
VPEGIDQIIKLEAAYDRLADDAKANRWETAERYAQLLDTGKSQREVARLVGKSPSHVNKMSSAWRRHGGVSLEKRPLFQDVYRELSAKPEAPAIDSAPKEDKPGKYIPTPGKRPRVGSYGRPRSSTAAVGNGSGFLDRHAQPEPDCTGSCPRCCG